MDSLIQSGISTTDQPRMVRGSDGTLYVVYTLSGQITVAYSIDGGNSWTQVTSNIGGTNYQAIAIDRNDVVYIAYKSSTTTVRCVQFINGAFSTDEQVTSATDEFPSFGVGVSIAIDSVNNVHVAWGQSVPSGYSGIYYNKRTSGTWAAPTQLSLVYNSPHKYCQIAIDSNDYIYIVFRYSESNDTANFAIKYLKFTSFWTSAVQIANTVIYNATEPRFGIDSLDNVHVVYGGTSGTLYYIKYTKLTDSWASEVLLTTSTAVTPTISIDASNNLDVVYSDTSNIFSKQNTGSWASSVQILTAAMSHAFTTPQTQSTQDPTLNGRRTNRALTGYHFTYVDTVSAVAILRYFSSSDFTAENNAFLISLHDSIVTLEGSGNGLVFSPAIVITNVHESVTVTEGSIGNGGITIALGSLTNGPIFVGSTGALGTEVYEFFEGLTDDGNPINMNVEQNNMQIVTFNSLFEPRILQMEVKEGNNVQLFVAYDDGAFKSAGTTKRGYTKVTLDVDPMTDAFPRCRMMKVAWREYSSNRCTISRMAVLGYEVPDEEDYRQ